MFNVLMLLCCCIIDHSHERRSERGEEEARRIEEEGGSIFNLDMSQKRFKNNGLCHTLLCPSSNDIICQVWARIHGTVDYLSLVMGFEHGKHRNLQKCEAINLNYIS